ncbi:MAG TPA: hypothetical protein VME46_21005 [Acidimicrobiales bacterium]|nr:hypothetical protein [Acidimicrobiales bacterium]
MVQGPGSRPLPSRSRPGGARRHGLPRDQGEWANELPTNQVTEDVPKGPERPAGSRACQVACVNPAALSGGTAELDPYFLTLTQVAPDPYIDFALKKPVPTPWVTYPGLYSARCEQGDGATWLQVTSLAGKSHTRPLVNLKVVSNLGGTGPAWGYHGYEYGFSLGNLLRDVASEEAAWDSPN